MKQIRAEVGKEFEITLDANPTTGYSWEASFDDTFLQLIEQRYERTSDLIGGGGHAVFAFRPVARGRGRITLSYRRPWEGKAIETIYCEVIVP
jgi:inhibitor of cysteine peptidase